MATAYERARDAVTAVEKAWQRLDGECDRAAAEADRLQVLAHELGVDGLPDLADVRVRLQAIKTSADNDPLGATEALTGGVFEQLRALDDRLAALRERRRAVQTGLGQARDLVTKLREAHDRALSAQDRCRGQIALDPDHGLPAPSDPRLIQGFGEWLATLEATTQAGHWSSAGVGLDRWISSAQQALATESEAERAALALLDRRDELLGRLLARRQQALALAARGKVLKIATEEIGERAESLLRQVPTPLAEAAALVAVYEAGLRQP
jgi:hypothetical protein